MTSGFRYVAIYRTQFFYAPPFNLRLLTPSASCSAWATSARDLFRQTVWICLWERKKRSLEVTFSWESWAYGAGRSGNSQLPETHTHTRIHTETISSAHYLSMNRACNHPTQWAGINQFTSVCSLLTEECSVPINLNIIQQKHSEKIF